MFLFGAVFAQVRAEGLPTRCGGRKMVGAGDACYRSFVTIAGPLGSGCGGSDARAIRRCDRGCGEMVTTANSKFAGPKGLAGSSPATRTSRPCPRVCKLRCLGFTTLGWGFIRTVRLSRIAQLVEQATVNRSVVGSSPTSGARTGIAGADRKFPDFTVLRW